jgi:protease-4
VWSGARSVELGLADGLGSVESVARDVIKAPDIIDFTEKQNVAERLARRFGAGVGTSLGQVMGNALSGVGLR